MTFAKEARDSIEMLQYLGLDDKEDRFFGAFAIAKTSKYE